MKPVLALVTLGLLAAVLFGFGQLIGAWETAASAEPEAATATTTARETAMPVEERTRKRSEKAQRPRRGENDSRPGRKGLPASVVRRLDKICRRAHADALAIAAEARPTSKKRLRQLFERLGELNASYNRAALEAFGRHAVHPRARTLARLFGRDEQLFGQLLADIAALDSPAGRARFERRLEELRRVGIRESEVLVALGARSCDSAAFAR